MTISASNAEFLGGPSSGAKSSSLSATRRPPSSKERFDLLISSLVFKHLYPTFEAALHNVAAALEPRALAFFDLMEGNGSSAFNVHGIAYLKTYRREEVAEILRRCGLPVVGFDVVRHHEGYERLLTVAKRRRDLGLRRAG